MGTAVASLPIDSGAQPVCLRRVAAIARTRPPVVLPSAMVALTGRLMSPLGRLVPLPPQYAAESMRASLATDFGTPDKAEREPGWSCRDLDDGLRETVVARDS